MELENRRPDGHQPVPHSAQQLLAFHPRLGGARVDGRDGRPQACDLDGVFGLVQRLHTDRLVCLRISGRDLSKFLEPPLPAGVYSDRSPPWEAD